MVPRSAWIVWCLVHPLLIPTQEGFSRTAEWSLPDDLTRGVFGVYGERFHPLGDFLQLLRKTFQHTPGSFTNFTCTAVARWRDGIKMTYSCQRLSV